MSFLAFVVNIRGDKNNVFVLLQDDFQGTFALYWTKNNLMKRTR